MQRNNAIDAVKGFAILLVMLGHCIVLNGLNETDPYIYDAIKSVQMPLFMAVSGALAGMSYARKKSISPGVLKKRAVSYLLPFFSWFVLVFFITHGLDGSIGVHIFMKELIALLFQTDRGLWFLTTLFEVTVVVTVAQYLTDIVCKKKNGEEQEENRTQEWKRIFCLLVLLFVFYVLFFLQARSSFLLFSPSLAVQYMPFYVVFYLWFGYGNLCRIGVGHAKSIHGIEEKGKDETNRSKAGAWILWGICLAEFLYMVIAFDLNKAPEGMVELTIQMLTSLAGCYVCFFGIYTVYENKYLNQKKEGRRRGFLLPWIGQYTLEIYVLHFRFARLLSLEEKNLTFYSVRTISYLFATFLLMSVCTAVCIYLISRSRLLNKIFFGK